MPSLTYSALFGDRTRKIYINQVNGAQGYHVFIDDLYQGAVLLVNGKLEAHMVPRTDLSGDDVAAMLEVIDAEFGK